MKKLVFYIVAMCVLLSFSMFGGFMWGYQLADSKASMSALNEDSIDIVITVVEQENLVKVETYHCDLEKRYLVLNATSIDDETKHFMFIFEIQRVAPFRYEWVEVL